MSRVKISAFILSALIILSVVSGIWVNKRCSELLAMIENVRTLSAENDTESAIKAAGELEKSWERFRNTANVMVKSDKLSEIDRIDARIIPLLKNGSEEIDAELDELTKMITVLQNGEKPLFTSVF